MKMIKKILMLLLMTSMIFNMNVSGSNKKSIKILGKVVINNNVNYSFENGVLTVSGNGVMDDTFSEKYKREDIKSVIIKDGITGISDWCLDDCYNMRSIKIPESVTKIGHYALGCNDNKIQELVIPNTVKEIGEEGLGSSFYKKVTMPATIKVDYLEYEKEECPVLYDGANDIYLNTKYNPKMKNVLFAKNIYTCSDDKKYSSKKGIIYSKDGKTLIQVPALRKRVVIRKGCTTVRTSALGYYRFTGDGEILPHIVPSSIKIPSSVRKIKHDLDVPKVTFEKKVNWIVKTGKLSGRSIENLCSLMSKKEQNKFFKTKNAKTKVKNKMAITKDGVLIRYTGKKTSIKIPKNVKRIGRVAFERKKLKKVMFNKKLKSVGESAFEDCVDLKIVKWNKGLKRIEKCAFAFTEVRKKKLPKKTKVDKDAFYKGI